MIWCKVFVSSLLVMAASASLEHPRGSGAQLGAEVEYGEGDEVPTENLVPNESPRNSHANHLNHDEKYTAQRYKFGYKIIDKYGNKQVREEEADEYNNRKGYYSFIDHDGKHRKVEYVADGHGFRAIVVTNEPGTAHSHPAEAKIIASPVNRVAPAHDGGRFIDPRTTLSAGSETSAIYPQSASANPVAAVAHRASLAHVAHAGAAIAVQVPRETGPLALQASVVPTYLRHNPQRVRLVVPMF